MVSQIAKIIDPRHPGLLPESYTESDRQVSPRLPLLEDFERQSGGLEAVLKTLEDSQIEYGTLDDALDELPRLHELEECERKEGGKEAILDTLEFFQTAYGNVTRAFNELNSLEWIKELRELRSREGVKQPRGHCQGKFNDNVDAQPRPQIDSDYCASLLAERGERIEVLTKNLAKSTKAHRTTLSAKNWSMSYKIERRWAQKAASSQQGLGK
jgi:hypothetical protein